MLKKILVLFVALAVIAVAAVVAALNVAENMLQPVDPVATEEYVIVEIPSGSGSAKIASILEDEGLIQNQLAFRYYTRRQNLDQSFMAGVYHLSPSMSAEQIASIIVRGDVYFETVWFTIPEGYSIAEVAAKLADEGLVSEDQFLAIARNPSDTLIEHFPFLADIDDSDIDYLLEGYLFPDTYEIYSGADEKEIVTIMLKRLESLLLNEHQARLDELDLNLHEILTLASIVEREGRVDHERALIAGVFYNRLGINMRLESCATIQFILGETKEFLTYQDLEIPSPYNTYQHAGLPPGPIAAPGEASILAALYPEKSDYYFFNYKYDTSGEHYFSRNLQEHNANVDRAESNIE